MFGVVGDTHRVLIRREESYLLRRLPFGIGFFFLAFSYLGGNLTSPCCFILHSLSSHSCVLCSIINKLCDVGQVRGLLGDTFLHWKAEMTSEAICMIFTGI